MSARIGSVLAGMIVPSTIPEAIGTRGWAMVMAERIQADGFVVLPQTQNTAHLIEAAASLQQQTNKPTYLRLTVCDMHAKELQRVLDAASRSNISAIFISQGYEKNNDPMRLNITKALDIFTRVHASNSQKPLLACPVPLPRPYRTQEEAYDLLAQRVAAGVNQLFIPPWQDPLSTACYLEESKLALPEVIQTICPVESAKAWKEIRSYEPISSSQTPLRTVKRETSAVKCLHKLTSEKVPLKGIYVNLSLSADDNLERIIGKVKELSITGSKI